MQFYPQILKMSNKKNILIIFYSQTGQLEEILKSMFSSCSSTINTEFCKVTTKPEYNFPWSSKSFFDTMPESVTGSVCYIQYPESIFNKSWDLIIIGFQVWFLSPSIPVHSILQDEKIKKLIKNKPVITVGGVRNMWINAFRKIKFYLKEAEAKLAGNIVLIDRVHNLVSVITISRWLLKGKKEATQIFPAAGVSSEDIKNAERFGFLIEKALMDSNYDNLQNSFIKEKAVKINYSIMKIELTGFKIFKKWATVILKSKNYKIREKRLKLFKIYLLFVIYVVSPFASLIFKIKYLIFNKKSKNEIISDTKLY